MTAIQRDETQVISQRYIQCDKCNVEFKANGDVPADWYSVVCMTQKDIDNMSVSEMLLGHSEAVKVLATKCTRHLCPSCGKAFDEFLGSHVNKVSTQVS